MTKRTAGRFELWMSGKGMLKEMEVASKEARIRKSKSKEVQGLKGNSERERE